ncbi:MAG: hypothetical protein GX946_04735 [Oligosphaeraceae bacterium]|nr:hypothetical protein [Oligosphaeraceae bacterium]
MQRQVKIPAEAKEWDEALAAAGRGRAEAVAWAWGQAEIVFAPVAANACRIKEDNHVMN